MDESRREDINDIEGLVEKMYVEIQEKEKDWDDKRKSYEKTIDNLKKEKEEEVEEMQQEIDYLNQ